MFRIESELELVVELGWYKEDKRKELSNNELEDREEVSEARKKARMDENNRNQISLGSLSLPQVKEINKRNELTSIENTMGAMIKEMAAERAKIQKEMDIMFRKIQTLEEEKTRHCFMGQRRKKSW